MMLVKVAAPLLAVFLVVVSEDLVGGPQDADINNPEVQDALRFAVDQYNAQSNSLYTSQVVEVIKVETQVVSGVKYIFTVKMARTSCKKTEADNSCDAVTGQSNECKLAVWSKPWENSTSLIENTC